MMKIVAAFLFGTQRLAAFKLDFIQYLHRNAVRELLFMFAEQASQDVGRKIYTYNDQYHFVCCRFQDRAAVLVTDTEYPSRISFELVQRILETPEENILKYIVDMCQDPRQIDSIFRVRQQLDETLFVVHENIDKLMTRGDDLDVLVSESKKLSDSTKIFYRTARRHNRCCTIS